jgi:autotransporter passenger strand-loop-strand repeat protein
MTSTFISSGNYQDTVVSSGATIVIGPFAVATNDGVANGGTLIILSGARDELTTVSSGGFEFLSGGSSISNGLYTPIQGTQIVYAGGLASRTDLGSGGQIFVSSGGEVAGALVSAGGTISVDLNGDAVGDSLIQGAVEIVSGGNALGEIVNGGAVLTLSAGSVDAATLLGGALVVFGGMAAETAISSGGREDVDAGAKTSADSVFASGVQSVVSKGSASDVTVFAGGSQTVASAGTALQTVLSGGAMVVSAGGSAADVLIATDGTATILAGATLTGGVTFAGSGGVLHIDATSVPAITVSAFAGGDTIDLAGIGFTSGAPPVLGSGNVLSFSEGGSAYTLAFDPAQNFAGVTFQLVQDGVGTDILASGGNTYVGSGQRLTIAAGQSSGFLTVDGGNVSVTSGGAVSASIVDNGGVVEVDAAGFASGVTVGASGNLTVAYTPSSVGEGSATGVTVEAGGLFAAFGPVTSTVVNGGTFAVAAGATAISTTIDSGGLQNERGTAMFTIVNGGGSLSLANDGGPDVTIGTILNAGGSETVSAVGTASDTTISGGLLHLGAAEYANAVKATGTIGFGPGAGTLEIDSGVVLSATISGFALGDTIDLTSLAPGAAPSATIDTTHDTVVVNGGSATVTLQFAAGDIGDVFHVTGDAGSGTQLTALACFVAGTRIATARGEVPVESLTAEDRVRTRDGRFVPVRWIGHRTVECRRHPKPRAVWPVRVRAGAFGPGLPRRDLKLSPDHAVFWGDVLIPIGHLIDGTAIVQEAAESVGYWHVELDRHDVVLAEGLPCESFLDTGNRAAFANGGNVVQAHPDFAARVWDAEACAPLVVGGPRLAEARRGLSEVQTTRAVQSGSDVPLKIHPLMKNADNFNPPWPFAIENDVRSG